MKTTHCPACGSDRLSLMSTPESVEFKGAHVHVARILSTTCESCEYSFATNEQHDANVAAARTAHVEQRAAVKIAKGLLTGAELRAAREGLGLNQKEAAELFGGGPVAFSKYENEDVTQSVAMDRLVRMVGHMGAFGVATLREASSAKPMVATAATASPGAKPETFVVVFKVPADSKAARTRLVQRPTPSVGAFELTPQGIH